MIIKGKIQKNDGRGKGLGFPTANFPADEKAEDGLYVGWVLVDGKKLSALIFIGAAVTFGKIDRQVEIFILDFSGDIYEKEVEVELLSKLRNNIKFPDAKTLIEQMKKDEIEAREFFKGVKY